MTDGSPSLGTISLFEDLSPEELDVVSELTTEVRWQAGEEVYTHGEQGGSLFAVLDGAVELFGIVSGVEKLFMTVRSGGIFGLLSMLDEGDRPGNARALEDTHAVVLHRNGLDGLLRDHPSVGIQLLQGVGKVLGERVRTLTEQYDASLAWNLEVTGLSRFFDDRYAIKSRICSLLQTFRIPDGMMEFRDKNRSSISDFSTIVGASCVFAVRMAISVSVSDSIRPSTF